MRVKNDPLTNKLTAPCARLIRPSINYSGIVQYLLCMFVFIGSSALITIFIFNIVKLEYEIVTQINQCIIILFWALSFLIFTLNRVYIFSVRMYQRYANAEIRLRCCFQPSCSEYSILAVRKYGLLVGLKKTKQRVERCGAPGGMDFP